MNVKGLMLAMMSLLVLFLSFAQNKIFLWQEGVVVGSYEIGEIDSITFSASEQSADSSAVDIADMPSDAKTLARKIFAGINLGNTMESSDGFDGDWCPDGETCWGAKKVDAELVKQYKASGFNAVRIPSQWYDMIEPGSDSYKIRETWMSRVQKVVDFVVDEDMYAILNIHWDNGWLENNITDAKKDEVNKVQKALWQQIADRFKNYDEHLIFASANEPNLLGSAPSINKDDGLTAEEEAEISKRAEVLRSYHQTFIDVVRASGGNNLLRNVIIQGPGTDIDQSLAYDVLPKDEVQGRMMFEVHFYPYTYALMESDADWSPAHYFWGNQPDFMNIVIDGKNHSVEPGGWCGEEYVQKQFKAMKSAFVDGKGLPVILGEYCVMNRDLSAFGNHSTGESYQSLFERSRAYYYEFVNREAKNNGLIPFLWETPGDIYERVDNAGSGDFSVVKGRQMLLDGIMKGAADGKYPF